MDRVQNAAYYHARQACYTCLQTHDLVDTSVQIEGEGVLALCRGCVRDMALTAGFDLTDRHNEIEALKIELKEAETRAEEAEAVLANLKTYSSRLQTAQAATRAKRHQRELREAAKQS